MKLSTYTGGFVQTNGYLLETPDGNLLIDAPEGVTEWLREKGVRVDDVLLTHQHYDHVMDAAALRENGARLHAFEEYSQDLTLESAARGWGLPIQVRPYQIDSRIFPPAPIHLAGLDIEISHVPGHSTDSITFHLREHALVFAGDTIFSGSIGRTDLPGGSTTQLLDGIAAHLMTLPAETRVFPGHGPATTIGEEAASNPYLD